MPIEHHPVIAEFPNNTDTIHRLKAEDPQFQRLMDEYEKIDKEVFRMEEGIETPEDIVLNEKKKLRLHLKDQLAEKIDQAER